VAEAAAVGVERKPHGCLDAVRQEGDGRMGRRIDPETGRREEGFELGVATGFAEALAVEATEVGDADGGALEDGAEASGCTEQALGGIEHAHQDAGAVQVAGHTRHCVQDLGD